MLVKCDITVCTVTVICDYKLQFNTASFLTIQLHEICTLQPYLPKKGLAENEKLTNSNFPVIYSDNVFF